MNHQVEPFVLIWSVLISLMTNTNGLRQEILIMKSAFLQMIIGNGWTVWETVSGMQIEQTCITEQPLGIYLILIQS